MSYDELITHYGSAEKAAAAIGLTRQGVFRWKGREIPLEHQVAYEGLTNGALRADLPEHVRVA
jgi:DNA-binding transcriptional regulator Cro